MKLLLDCRALARLISQAQDDTLPLALRARMRLHMVNCQACCNVNEQIRFARAAMQEIRMTPPAATSAVASLK